MIPEWLFWVILGLFAWANTYANYKSYKAAKITSERITSVHDRVLKLEYPEKKCIGNVRLPQPRRTREGEIEN